MQNDDVAPGRGGLNASIDLPRAPGEVVLAERIHYARGDAGLAEAGQGGRSRLHCVSLVFSASVRQYDAAGRRHQLEQCVKGGGDAG